MPQQPLDFSMFSAQPTKKQKTGLDLSMFGAEQDVEETTPSTFERVKRAVPEPVRNTVSVVLDLLGRPGAATAGAVNAFQRGEDISDRVMSNLKGERRDDFDQVLEDSGMEDSTLRHVAGFGLDMVVDPLNLVGVGAVKSAVGAVGKAAGKASATAATKVLPQGVLAAGKQIKDDLGERFVPRYGTTLKPEDAETLRTVGSRQIDSPDAFRDDLRAFQKERSTIPVRVEKNIISRYKGTDPQFREDVLEGMDSGAGKTPEVDAKVLEQTKVNDDLFEREVDAMVQKEGNYRPDYAPADYSRSKGKNLPATNPQSALNARLKYAKARKDKEMTISEHVAQGAEPDVALAQLSREIAGEKAVLTGNFIQDVTKKYGLHVKDAPSDWVTLTKLKAETPLQNFTEDIAFPSYVAKEIEKMRVAPKEKTKLGQLYDQAMDFWRSQATVLRPGFHSTNMQGNVFNGAVLAGALNPMRYLEAAKWNGLKAKGFQGAPPIGKYSAQEVDEYMDRFGVGGAGHSFTSELMEDGADKVLMAKLSGKGGLSKNPLSTINPAEAVRRANRAGKWLGQGLEDFSKRALFLDQLHKGKSLEDAAKTVDKYLFDYADLTDFEKTVAKRIFPFYTWMRKNVPLQVEQVVKQPHKYAAVSKAQQAIEGVAEERGVVTPEGERPEWLQSQNAVQLPTEKGDPKKFWSPYLPYQDLNKVPVPGGTTVLRAGQELASGIEPFSKGVAEMLTNKSLFFNRRLYDSELGKNHPLGAMWADRQKIPASLAMLPDEVLRVLPLLQEVEGKNGPEFQTPALVRYALQQLPLMEATGKAVQSIATPEDAPNPYNWLSPTLGVRLTERTSKQEHESRKEARSDAKRVAAKEKRQNKAPVKKAKVDSLFERYRQEP